MMEFILYGCAASFLTSNGNDGFKILYLLCIMTLDLFWRDMCMHQCVNLMRHCFMHHLYIFLNVSILEAT